MEGVIDGHGVGSMLGRLVGPIGVGSDVGFDVIGFCVGGKFGVFVGFMLGIVVTLKILFSFQERNKKNAPRNKDLTDGWTCSLPLGKAYYICGK